MLEPPAQTLNPPLRRRAAEGSSCVAPDRRRPPLGALTSHARCRDLFRPLQARPPPPPVHDIADHGDRRHVHESDDPLGFGWFLPRRDSSDAPVVTAPLALAGAPHRRRHGACATTHMDGWLCHRSFLGQRQRHQPATVSLASGGHCVGDGASFGVPPSSGGPWSEAGVAGVMEDYVTYSAEEDTTSHEDRLGRWDGVAYH